jgi:hypothetical protein
MSVEVESADGRTLGSGRPCRLPNWLRLGWLRASRGRRRGGTSGWAVFWQLDHWLDQVAGRKCRPALLDPWGSAVLGGKTCFVTETPVNFIDAVTYLALLADLLGCRMDIMASSGLPARRLRIILFPPKERQ